MLTPIASGADPGGNSGDASRATAQCTPGYTYDSGSGTCEKHETKPAGKSCPATISGHAVRVSGSDCVTATAHTRLPTYTCDTANAGNPAVRFALVGDPPECQRTVTRRVATTRTVTDMVHFTEPYQKRVAVTNTVRVPYTVRVRVPPLTERVRVKPFTRTYTAMETYTYTVRVRYCAKWDVVVGQSVCVRHRYRDEQRTGVRETLITEPVYRYENRPAYNYRSETRYRNVTRTTYEYRPATRVVCCRPVTRTITVTRTVRDTQTAVPDATCTAAGYALNSSSGCERPAGTRLGGVAYRCMTGWTAVSGDPSSCERTLTRDPTSWSCETGKTIDRSTSPPHCHPDPDAGDEEGEEDQETEEPDDDEDEPEEEDGPPECTTALGTLGAGTVTRSGTWATGCTSVHKSTDQVPYWAWRYTFTLTAAATLDLDAASAGDPHVFITDSEGTVVGSDDDSGADGRDSRIRGLSLRPGPHTVEVTTGSERSTGRFTLTLRLAAAVGGVRISGFGAAEGTPAVGKNAVVVSSGFTVSPAGATCASSPAGAAVSPSSGAQRTASLSVAAATSVTVTVTCTSGAHRGTASAVFKANAAPVRISGLSDASAPAGDAATAVVSSGFAVSPAGASCAAAPAGARVAPATGARRTASLAVAKGTTVTVTVTCSKNGASAAARAKLTATRFGSCASRLGSFGPAGVTVRGTLSAKGDCTSARRHPSDRYTFWARRHVLVMAHPGWVTVALESDRSNTRPLDTYLLILAGGAADGSGRRLAHNDDQGTGPSAQALNSRIAGKFLPAGTYTIEATTRYPNKTGRYTLHITTNHTPQTDQPATLRAEVGKTIRKTWAYRPGSAIAAVTSTLPAGVTATFSAADGLAALAVTSSKTGKYRLTIGYTNGPGTLAETTAVAAECPATRAETDAGTCVPRTGSVATDCNIAWLHTGLAWGLRRAKGHFSDFDGGSSSECSSLAGLGGAKHYKFYLPKSVPAHIELGALNLVAHGGTPLVSLWRYVDHDNGGDVRFAGAVQTKGNATPVLKRTLAAGTYVVEIAATKPVARSLPKYELRAWLPTATKTHADVQRVGNTGLGDAGLGLGGFLNVRGSLAYNDHSDPAQRTDPAVAFDPLSPTYPWLPFTTDRCSIPPAWILHLAENVIDKAAIRLGPLAWLAARYLLPNANEIQDHPQFGGVTVPFVYGCMRHDFNWRNLHRVKHHLGYDTATGTWNNTVREDADGRLGTDLVGLCKSKQTDAPEASRYHTWKLPNRSSVGRCELAARTIRSALGKVPFGWIGYVHG